MHPRRLARTQLAVAISRKKKALGIIIKMLSLCSPLPPVSARPSPFPLTSGTWNKYKQIFGEMFHPSRPLLGCWERGPHPCYRDLLQSFSESVKTLLRGKKKKEKRKRGHFQTANRQSGEAPRATLEST